MNGLSRIYDRALGFARSLGLTGYRQSDEIIAHNKEGELTLFHKGDNGKSFEKALVNGSDSEDMNLLRLAEFASIIGKAAKGTADSLFACQLVKAIAESDIDKDSLMKGISEFSLVKVSNRKGEEKESSTPLNDVPFDVLLAFANAAIALNEAMIGVQTVEAKAAKTVKEFDPSAAKGKRKNSAPPKINSQRTPNNPGGEGAASPTARIDKTIESRNAAAKVANAK